MKLGKKVMIFSLYCISSEDEWNIEEILTSSSFEGIIIVSAISENVIQKKIERKKRFPQL